MSMTALDPVPSAGAAINLPAGVPLTVSIFRSDGGPISKRYGLDEAGKLLRANGGYLTAGTVKTKHFATVFDVARFANASPPDVALGFGVCGHDEAQLVTAARRHSVGGKGVVARTKEDFAFAVGAGILHIDYDPRPGEKPLTPDEFVKTLRAAVPELALVAMAVKSSSTAYIFHPDGSTLKSAGGLHVFIPVEDSSLIPTLGRVIDQRLWLAGRGWIKITGNGTRLLVTCIDVSVLSPERLCFCSARCEDGVTQSLPEVRYYPGEADDLIGSESRLSTLSPISRAEADQLAELQREAFAAAASEADAIQRGWAERRVDDACAYAAKRGNVADRDDLLRSFTSDLGQVLPAGLILHLHDGGEASVRDLLREPRTFHGRQMADPIEPTYGGDGRIAMAVLDAGEPYIFSHAHGGQRYLLRTEGERLDDILADFVDLGDLPLPRRRFEAVPASEFAAGGPTEWFVPAVLPDATLGVLYGASGSGKSFLALDMVADIALGQSWRSRDVRQSDVVYVCAEGAAGFRKRIRAYEQQRGCSFGSALRMIGDQPNLLAGDDLEQLTGEIAHVRPRLVVIDTLAQIMPGGDENNSVDMGKVLAACRRLHEETGAMILLVHHSGKDAAKGARGWSGLRAAADVELEVSKEGTFHTLRVTKMKDGESDLAFPFRLLPIEVEVGTDGEAITSCVIEHVEGAARRPAQRPKLGNVEAVVLDAFGGFLSDGRSGIAIADLLGEAASRLAHDPGTGSAPKRDQRRERCKRALDKLIEKGLVTITGDKILLAEDHLR